MLKSRYKKLNAKDSMQKSLMQTNQLDQSWKRFTPKIDALLMPLCSFQASSLYDPYSSPRRINSQK